MSLLSSCSKEEPTLEITPDQTNQVTKDFSPQQLELLQQLSEINDSIAADGIDAVGETRAEVNLRKIIAAADARGFKQGWQFGRTQGKNIFSKLIMGGICASMTSVFYSVCAAITYPLFGEVYLRNPDVQTIMIVTSNILGTPEGKVRIEQYKSWFDNSVISATDDELTVAICHNLVLEDYAEGTIYPSGNVDKVFSKEEQLFYKSYKFSSFHQSIPSFVNGTKDFDATYNISGYDYENAIFDQYIDGLYNIKAISNADLIAKTKTLCLSYHKAIVESNTLSQDSESMMNSSLFVLPLSLDHWSNR